MSIHTSKQLMRQKIKNILKTLTQQNKDTQSAAITEKILNSNVYKMSRRVGIYLSMPEEVNTDQLVRELLHSSKECYIPRCTKDEMFMEKLNSVEDYISLPTNRFGIKEPLEAERRDSCFVKGGLDLVLVPGLGFTMTGHRLGRGKGYYDKFLLELKTFHDKNNTEFKTIGIAYKEQILDDIPCDEKDFLVDSIITG